MQIRGAKAPVIGRVAMQTVVLDVTDIPGVQVGDEVIVPAMRIPTSARCRGCTCSEERVQSCGNVGAATAVSVE